MRKYYTIECNFYHGELAKRLIKNKKALSLNGNKYIAFDKIELLSRENKNKFLNLEQIKKQSHEIKKIISRDLKVITSKKKNFLKNINFLQPTIMGVLNLTPDSFSDAGTFNNKPSSSHLIFHKPNFENTVSNLKSLASTSIMHSSMSILMSFSKLSLNSVSFLITLAVTKSVVS